MQGGAGALKSSYPAVKSEADWQQKRKAVDSQQVRPGWRPLAPAVAASSAVLPPVARRRRCRHPSPTPLPHPPLAGQAANQAAASRRECTP